MLLQLLKVWLILCVLDAMPGSASAQSETAAPPPATAVGATAGAAACSLNITGFGNRPGIHLADLSCTGGTITVAAHKVLQDYWGPNKTLPGVKWGDANCRIAGLQGCLLAVCGASNAVFDAATITALVGEGTIPGWFMAVCVSNQSTATFRNSSFTFNNKTTPIFIGARQPGTSVLLEQCTIHGNTFTTTGKNNSLSAGIAVLGANVDIFSSTISANTVSGDAYGSGALTILAMAQVRIHGTQFSKNAASDGAAIHADFSATVDIQSSLFADNRANAISSGRGGAVFATGQAQVKVLPSKPGKY